MADSITAAVAGSVTFGELTVNRLGLGTNRITDTPEARELLKRAAALEINFIDTAYSYTDGASETTIGNTLAPYAPGLIIATKGGRRDSRPEDLREQLEASLQRLQVDRIDLYQLHRLNPDVPLEDSVGMLKKLQDEGKIRHVGLSEVTVEQLERAARVTPIVSVQNEYNVLNRQYDDVLEFCTRRGIAFIPWFPLGGLAGDAEKVNALLGGLADRHEATPQQIALAWLLARSPMMLPIPGTLSIEHLEANLRAGAVRLSDEDYEQITAGTITT